MASQPSQSAPTYTYNGPDVPIVSGRLRSPHAPAASRNVTVESSTVISMSYDCSDEQLVETLLVWPMM
jgi:hypothetical protein